MDLEPVHCKGKWLKVPIKLIHRQFSAAQVAVTVPEADRDQHHAFIHPEAQEHYDLVALLPEIHWNVDDHSSLLQSSQDMLFYDVNQAFNSYLDTTFDPVSKHTMAFALSRRVR